MACHNIDSRLIFIVPTVAKRKTLFDDRPNEINELTFVIKQDLASLNAQISSLQSLSKSQIPQSARGSAAEQEGEHNKNVSEPSIPRLKRNVAKVDGTRLWSSCRESLRMWE